MVWRGWLPFRAKSTPRARLARLVTHVRQEKKRGNAFVRQSSQTHGHFANARLAEARTSSLECEYSLIMTH